MTSEKHEVFDSTLREGIQLTCGNSGTIKILGVGKPFYCPLCAEEINE